MDEIICVLGKKIKFTKERYWHIVVRHPELEENEIKQTLTNADFVQESTYHKSVLIYYRSANKGKYFVVAVKILNSHTDSAQLSALSLAESLHHLSA